MRPGYVDISGRGSQFRIKITEKGIAGTVMFSHTLAARQLPPSLR